MIKHEKIECLINDNMIFSIDATKNDLSEHFDDDLVRKILKEDEMRTNIKTITDLHAIIGDGFCTKKELQDLNHFIDKALQNGMCASGYVTNDDNINASCVCDLISADAYNLHNIKMIKSACERKLKTYENK